MLESRSVPYAPRAELAPRRDDQRRLPVRLSVAFPSSWLRLVGLILCAGLIASVLMTGAMAAGRRHEPLANPLASIDLLLPGRATQTSGVGGGVAAHDCSQSIDDLTAAVHVECAFAGSPVPLRVLLRTQPNGSQTVHVYADQLRLGDLLAHVGPPDRIERLRPSSGVRLVWDERDYRLYVEARRFQLMQIVTRMEFTNDPGD